jgi:hypothetical protein
MLALSRAPGEGWGMQSRARLGFSLLPLVAALLVPACKTVDKDADVMDASLLPVATVATADPPAVTTSTQFAPHPTAAAPSPVATTKLDAGVITDAGTVKVTDAGAANGTFKACSEKCQAVLQGCAIPQIPKDGGLPQFKDPVACQAAANACFAACTQ